GEETDAGETITFLVDGAAAGTAVYTPGTSSSLDLAVTGSTAPGGSSGLSSGSGSGSGSGPSATPTPTPTVTEPTVTGTLDTSSAAGQETVATTAPLTDPTLTFGPVASATAVQQAGLPFSWLTGLAALAGVALLVRERKR
ncbi:MAG TPA: hypothetical protein PLN84_13270, partial [Methanoculleus sp.]|nr:hypothetical protein [Methanoculleus sp.]